MNQFKHKVSIVVPIYNVQEYLEKCINSLVEQSYKNIEIILIDDGSTDDSSKICDRLKKRHKELIVIHKQNGGLSSARNSGINVATGDLITFVDSDDWLSNDAIESMVSDLDKYSADVVATSFIHTFSDGRQIDVSKWKEPHLLSSSQSLEVFLYNEYLTPCACAKLYKKELWENIRFPEGKLFEDQFTIYKVIDLANRVVFNPNGKYFYFKRSGSIGHSKFTKKTYDLYEAINEEYKYIVNKYSKLKNSIVVAKLTWEIVFLNMMLEADSSYYDKNLINRIRCEVRNNTLNIINSKYISVIRKIQMILLGNSLSIYQLVYKKYKNANPGV